MQLDEVIPLISPLIAVLDKQGIKYAIGGSVAAILYGATLKPNGSDREPGDVDLLANIKLSQVPNLVYDLFNFYDLVLGPTINSAISSHSSFNIISPAFGSTHIDIFCARPDNFEISCFNDARSLRIDTSNPREFLVMRPEDVVTYKLQHVGNNPTDRDRYDIRQILRTQSAKNGGPGIEKLRIGVGARHFNIVQLGMDAIRDAGI
jgi:hypothetical protein